MVSACLQLMGMGEQARQTQTVSRIVFVSEAASIEAFSTLRAGETLADALPDQIHLLPEP